MNNCHNCPSKEQPECCSNRPDEVQSANAEDRAWSKSVAKQEAKRQQQDNQSMSMGYGSLTGFRVGE